jgi:hypothetical protein
MKWKIRNIAMFYVAVPSILGLIVTYISGYFLHPLDPNDWYFDGFPVGWKKLEGTGLPPHPQVFTFFNPLGFAADVLFWCGATLVIGVVLGHVWSTRG